jgi:hypothetical protein
MMRLRRRRAFCPERPETSKAEFVGDVRPHLMVTDPPFGVNYDPDWRNRAGAARTKRTGKVLNDSPGDCCGRPLGCSFSSGIGGSEAVDGT